jgi:hypothetical protein
MSAPSASTSNSTANGSNVGGAVCSQPGTEISMTYEPPARNNQTSSVSRNTVRSSKWGCLALASRRLANCSALNVTFLAECPLEAISVCRTCCGSCEDKRSAAASLLAIALAPFVATHESLCTGQYDDKNFEYCVFGQF